MIDGIGTENLEGAIEALLFVTDEPVGVLTLANQLECEPGRIEQALLHMQRRFENDNRGIQLREVAGGWRMYTHPAFNDIVEKYVLSWDTRKLSAAAMETLAIIAYTQPVTRQGVSLVRGVNSDSPISSLIEKGLVREMGCADTPGNPTLYGTTRVFLEKFGLRSTKDLTDISEFAPDEETRRLISERLSQTRQDAAVTEDDATAMAQQMMDSDIDEQMQSAIASTLGVVEKIDFDSLQFNFDDE